MSHWIPSAEAFGTPTQVTTLGVSGLPSAEAFGSATILNTSVITVYPTSALSGETFGVAGVASVLSPVGVVPQGVFGVPTIKSSIGLILCSATTKGRGRLLCGDVQLAGTVHGSGTIIDPAVIIKYASGLAYGSGQLVWNGPGILSGSSILTGVLQVCSTPKPICKVCCCTPANFSFGQVLGMGDLTICFCTPSDAPISPTRVTYTLYQKTSTGSLIPRGPVDRVPVMTDVGCFYATGTLNCGQPGSWCIIWTWETSPDCTESRTECFQVLDAAARNPCDPARVQKYGWNC